jgi:hypothetical protein
MERTIARANIKALVAMLASGLALVILLFPGLVPADDLDPVQLKEFVSGRKWVISFSGNLRDPSTVTYWDFRADGSVCARLVASKAGDKCADDGRWVVEGQKLCWELTWLGQQYAYKSACVRVQKVGTTHYDAISEKGGFRLMMFNPVK